MTISKYLLEYSTDVALLEEVDGLWEKHRLPGGRFLHELPPSILQPMLDAFADMKRSSEAATISKRELEEYQRISMSTERRLSYALDLLRGIADGKRGFSRVAIRGWIASLSVPLDTGPQFVALPEEAAASLGSRLLKRGRDLLLSGSYHTALECVFKYLETLETERAELHKQLEDFNKECRGANTKHAAEVTKTRVDE